MNPLSQDEEDLLLDKSLQEDPVAFAELIAPYRTRIYHLCLGVIKDQEMAEDLTQDAFIHAFTYLTQFRRAARFYTWLYRIALNLSLNALKKKRREHLTPLTEQTQNRSLPPKSLKRWAFLSPDQNMLEEEQETLLELIIQHLEALGPKHRPIFELYVLQEVKHKQIAELLDLPAGTVRSRLHYARKKMRALLSQGRVPAHRPYPQ